MNNVSLIGRLTKDVDLRYVSKNSMAVGSFTLAVNRDVKSLQGERKTDYISVVMWGKTAEFAYKYFSKGSRVGVTGEIHSRVWEDAEKTRHYVTEVVADKVYFADSKLKDDEDESTGECEEGIESEATCEKALESDVACKEVFEAEEQLVENNV